MKFQLQHSDRVRTSGTPCKSSLQLVRDSDRLDTSYPQALKLGSLALLFALVSLLPGIFMALSAAAAAAGTILLQSC